MFKTTSLACVKHAAMLSAYQLTAIPAENTTDAKVIARAELANLWVQTDCWSEGVLLELAEYLENYAYEVTGPDRFAVFDLRALARVMDSTQAALLVCRLAGAYRVTIGGKTLLANKDSEDTCKLVTFNTNFIRDFWEYLTDEMDWVLNLKKASVTPINQAENHLK